MSTDRTALKGSEEGCRSLLSTLVDLLDGTVTKTESANGYGSFLIASLVRRFRAGHAELRPGEATILVVLRKFLKTILIMHSLPESDDVNDERITCIHRALKILEASNLQSLGELYRRYVRAFVRPLFFNLATRR